MLKVGSIKTGGRDGTLVVIAADLSRAVKVPGIGATLQAALDHWDEVLPDLESTCQALNEGRMDNAFPLRFTELASPLPRAYQWADGSAYLNHAELVRR